MRANKIQRRHDKTKPEPTIETTEPEVLGQSTVVATTEPQASNTIEVFESALRDQQAIPVERKQATKENALWFIRKGWVFCMSHPRLDDIVAAAQELARDE